MSKSKLHENVLNPGSKNRGRLMKKTKSGYECQKECKGCHNIGSFNRSFYDNCEYRKDLRQSTEPLSYKLARYQFENCNKCTYDGKLWAPFDFVNEESELRNLTRPASRCDEFKYHPDCPSSEICISTYNAPVVYPPDVCPVVCNTLERKTHLSPKYIIQETGYCGELQDNEEFKRKAKNAVQRYRNQKKRR